MKTLTVLQSAREIVDGALAELGPGAQIERHEVLTTDEAEPAVLVFLRAADVEMAVGIVFGDDASHVVRDIRSGASKGWDEAVRAQLLSVSLGLSSTRPRRFYYRSPSPGWQAFADGLETTWVADDRSGRIIASPARLDAGTQPGLSPVEGSFEVKLTTKNGFSGTMTMQKDAAGNVVEEAVLSDGRFAYTLRFESSAARLAEHRRTFEDVIESIVLVPVGRTALMEPFAHWGQ